MGMQTGGHGELNSEINVTPFVDVMLVLLVIFMLTAPMMHTGVDIDLPATEAAAVNDPEGKLTLSIDKDRRLYLGATPIPWTKLADMLQLNERVRKEKTLWIEADQSLPYAVVVTAMATARKAGVQKLMMLTDPTGTLTLSELDKAAGATAIKAPK